MNAKRNSLLQQDPWAITRPTLAMETSMRPPRQASRQISSYKKFDVPQRIHILGTGSMGKFIAHALRGVPEPPPVTLLVHRPTFFQDFKDAGSSISMTTGGITEKQTGFDLELALPERVDLGKSHYVSTDRTKFAAYHSDEPIHNLVLTVKAANTISALSAVKHRLRPESTILFLQNGMGVVEEVNEKLFPDMETRPNYMLGVITHGVHSTSTTSIVYAGYGTISLGLLPRIPFKELGSKPLLERDQVIWGTSSRYLLRCLSRSPSLVAVPVPPTELLQAQLEKLAVNCIINPLTVMIDGRNEDLLYNHALSRVFRLLLAEICPIFQSLPELNGVPNVQSRFSPERLEAMVVNVASKTGQNISSMLQDVRRGVATEIEYLNGYVVKRGEEMGVHAVMNYLLMQMVIGKYQLISREIDNYTPFTYGKL